MQCALPRAVPGGWRLLEDQVAAIGDKRGYDRHRNQKEEGRVGVVHLGEEKLEDLRPAIVTMAVMVECTTRDETWAAILRCQKLV